jgi:hypothetical protein
MREQQEVRLHMKKIYGHVSVDRRGRIFLNTLTASKISKLEYKEG